MVGLFSICFTLPLQLHRLLSNVRMYVLQHNGRSSSSGNTRGGVMIRKRRPNWIDAPDDSFFLVTRETR